MREKGKTYHDTGISSADLPVTSSKWGHHQQQELSCPQENCHNSYLQHLNSLLLPQQSSLKPTISTIPDEKTEHQIKDHRVQTRIFIIKRSLSWTLSQEPHKAGSLKTIKNLRENSKVTEKQRKRGGRDTLTVVCVCLCVFGDKDGDFGWSKPKKNTHKAVLKTMMEKARRDWMVSTQQYNNHRSF